MVPLFKTGMDGTDRKDYVQRVEPSAQGGAKMAAPPLDAPPGRVSAKADVSWVRTHFLEKPLGTDGDARARACPRLHDSTTPRVHDRQARPQEV